MDGKLSLEKIKKGDSIPGDTGRIVKDIPDWVDLEKFERAKRLYDDYSSNISFGHLTGLFMIFLYTKRIEPFRITGKISTFVALLRRYISTVVHVRKWYTGDVWNPNDPAYKSLLVVRNMHKNVVEKLNKNLPEKSAIHGSQFAMGMTQFAFIGIITLFPKKLAIDWTKRDMECFIHFWRCIGYLLGMEEEYNICKGSYDDVLLLFNDILENEIKPGIKNPKEESVQMARDIVTVFSCISLLSWKSLSKYWAENLDIKFRNDLDVFDWIVYWWFRLVFGYLLWFGILRICFNYLRERKFNEVLNNMTYYEDYVRKYEIKLGRNKY